MGKPRVVRHEVVQPQDQSIKLIPLTRGQNAIVDSSDYDQLCQWSWFAHFDKSSNSFYAVRCFEKDGKKGMIRMHQQITGFKMTDHQNQNRLDNRRKNLRSCSKSQNAANSKLPKNNTSGFRGVRWNKNTGKWKSAIKVNQKDIHLGYFVEIDDAVKAYAVAARQHFGEFYNGA